MTFGLRVGAPLPPLATILPGFQIEPWMRGLVRDLHEASLAGNAETVELGILAVSSKTMAPLQSLQAAGVLRIAEDFDGPYEHVRITITQEGRTAFGLPV